MASAALSKPSIPIAKLQPNLDAGATCVTGIVTLIWPYASRNRSTSLLLVEPDFRLRRCQGQVRIQFNEASAKAVARAGIRSGEKLLLSLEGSSWAKDVFAANTPGRGIEWELQYAERLYLQVQRIGQDLITLNVDNTASSPERATAVSTSGHSSPANSYTVASTTRPLLGAQAWESPAFLKRSRISASSYDIFAEEETDYFPDNDRRKRPRLSHGSGQWRFADRTPSSERECETDVVGFASPLRSQEAKQIQHDSSDWKQQSLEGAGALSGINGDGQKLSESINNSINESVIVAPLSPPSTRTTAEPSDSEDIRGTPPLIRSRNVSPTSQHPSSASSRDGQDSQSHIAEDSEIDSQDDAKFSAPASDFGLDGSVVSRAKPSSAGPHSSMPPEEPGQRIVDDEVSQPYTPVPIVKHESNQPDHDDEGPSKTIQESAHDLWIADSEVSSQPDSSDYDDQIARQLSSKPLPSIELSRREQTLSELPTNTVEAPIAADVQAHTPTENTVDEEISVITSSEEFPQAQNGIEVTEGTPKTRAEIVMRSVQSENPKVEIIDLESEDEEIVQQTGYMGSHASHSLPFTSIKAITNSQREDASKSPSALSELSAERDQTLESRDSTPSFVASSKHIDYEFDPGTVRSLLVEKPETTGQWDTSLNEGQKSDFQANETLEVPPESPVVTGTEQGSTMSPIDERVPRPSSTDNKATPGPQKDLPAEQTSQDSAVIGSVSDLDAPEAQVSKESHVKVKERHIFPDPQTKGLVYSLQSPKDQSMLKSERGTADRHESHEPNHNDEKQEFQKSLTELPSTVQDSAAESPARNHFLTPITTQETSFVSRPSSNSIESAHAEDTYPTPQLTQGQSSNVIVPETILQQEPSPLRDPMPSESGKPVHRVEEHKKDPPKPQKPPTLIEKLKAMRRLSGQTPRKVGDASAASPWFAPKRTSQKVPDSEAESETESLSEGDRKPTGIEAIIEPQTPKQKSLAKSFIRSPSQVEGIPSIASSPGYLPPSQPPPPGFRTSLSYFVPLVTLQSHFALSVDVLAIALTATSVVRAASGPRDYSQSIYITDPSSASLKMPIVTAQIFRSHNKCFPIIEKGDAVLLRDFKVQSFQRQIILFSAQSSAWAVFRKDTDVQIRGPPVEFGAEERGFARGLWRWWADLSHDTRERLEHVVPKDTEKQAKGKPKFSKIKRDEEGKSNGPIKKEIIEGLGVDLPGSQGRTRKATPKEEFVSLDGVLESTEPPKRVLRPRGARGVLDRSESLTKAINRRSGTVFTGGLGQPDSE